ncbi:MAG: hypothetical protein FWF84_01795 [Kiritimatiellaeota bacterium]|nr:hypothetical protein [Kiritimatiellota bacterium]
MKTDTLIRNEGMEILASNLGLVDAERFVMLIQKEPFDYTKWQENLFNDMSVEELSKRAAEHRKNNMSMRNDI